MKRRLPIPTPAMSYQKLATHFQATRLLYSITLPVEFSFRQRFFHVQRHQLTFAHLAYLRPLDTLKKGGVKKKATKIPNTRMLRRQQV